MQKTIEDLSAKNSSLIAEVANLKLELAIVSQLAKAKDSTLSRMRRVKVSKIPLRPLYSFLMEAFLTGREALTKIVELSPVLDKLGRFSQWYSIVAEPQSSGVGIQMEICGHAVRAL